jgi:PEP-CTERM/exosortase A-associated glycosyltransferase
MRVLHVLHTSLPYICGYSIRSDYIVRFQKEQGAEAAVVTSAQHPNDDSLEETVNGVHYWRTKAYAGPRAPLLREWALMQLLQKRLDQVIARWKPDVIHAHSPMLVGLPALAAARKHRLPLVYEVRDLWENASVDRGRFAADSPLYRIAAATETRVLRQADAVVTICERLREAVTPRARSADRVFVVGNGVDTASFQPVTPDADVRARWKLGGKHVIGYIGTFQPYEGLDVLVRSMLHIRAERPDAHLVITGAGGVEAELRALASSLKLDDSVTFTGRLPHDEVRQMYAQADVMAYPRILTRTTALTTPLKPLEAMAMGKPVIVSDVPAMQELVRPGVTGLMARAGDAADLAKQCLQILGEPGQQSRMGNQAREWVLSERQWPQLIARYPSIYGAVTG